MAEQTVHSLARLRLGASRPAPDGVFSALKGAQRDLWRLIVMTETALEPLDTHVSPAVSRHAVRESIGELSGVANDLALATDEVHA